MDRPCVICGNTFKVDWHRRKTCSSECCKINLKQLRKQWYKDHYENGHPVIEQTCLNCSKTFYSRLKKKYCSKECISEHFLLSPKGRLYKKNKDKRHNEKHKEQLNAKRKYRYHFDLSHRRKMKARLMAGKRLDAMPCEVCGSTNDIQAHHKDYDKPLDVRWLCVKHHLEVHGKQLREEVTHG